MRSSTNDSLISRVKTKDPVLYEILRNINLDARDLNSSIKNLPTTDLTGIQAQIDALQTIIDGLSSPTTPAPTPSPTPVPSFIGYTATIVGQVLISLDGATFEPRMPVTDPVAGWLIDGGTGLLLVT